MKNADRSGFGGAELGAADCLSLAAAPTFAVMALLEAIGGGPVSPICAASPLSGMVPMYLLMCAFHLAPWLRLCARRYSSFSASSRNSSGTERKAPNATAP
jgi:hypothetical protein